VLLPLLYGSDDFSGNLLPGNIDEESRTVKPLKGFGRRREVIGLGQHVGRNRPSSKSVVPIGNPRRSARNPAVKWDSAAFEAE
jgi:hypothetical protein